MNATTTTEPRRAHQLGSAAIKALYGGARPRAVLYLRSAAAGPLDRRGDTAGIREQRLACQRLADLLHLRVIAEFSDLGVSGLAVERRGLDALLERTQLGDVALVIAWSPDRIARRADVVATIEEKLASSGVRALYASEYDARAAA